MIEWQVNITNEMMLLIDIIVFLITFYIITRRN